MSFLTVEDEKSDEEDELEKYFETIKDKAEIQEYEYAQILENKALQARYDQIANQAEEQDKPNNVVSLDDL